MLGHGDPHVLGFAVDYKRLKDGDQDQTPVVWDATRPCLGYQWMQTNR